MILSLLLLCRSSESSQCLLLACSQREHFARSEGLRDLQSLFVSRSSSDCCDCADRTPKNTIQWEYLPQKCFSTHDKVKKPTEIKTNIQRENKTEKWTKNSIKTAKNSRRTFGPLYEIYLRSTNDSTDKLTCVVVIAICWYPSVRVSTQEDSICFDYGE